MHLYFLYVCVVCYSVSVCLPSYKIVFASWFFFHSVRDKPKTKKREYELKTEDTTTNNIYLFFLFLFYHITLFIDVEKNIIHIILEAMLLLARSLSLSLVLTRLQFVHFFVYTHATHWAVLNFFSFCQIICELFSLCTRLSHNFRYFFCSNFN